MLDLLRELVVICHHRKEWTVVVVNGNVVECDVLDLIKLLIPMECEQSDVVRLVLDHLVPHLFRRGNKLSVDNVSKYLMWMSSCMMMLETAVKPENRG
jgi:hypothetical protein